MEHRDILYLTDFVESKMGSGSKDDPIIYLCIPHDDRDALERLREMLGCGEITTISRNDHRLTFVDGEAWLVLKYVIPNAKVDWSEELVEGFRE